MVSFPDCIVADHSRSAQGRVHFINAIESLDEGQDDEDEDVFTLDVPVEDMDEDDEDNVLDDDEDNVFEDDEV
jgi:hypothetical protein